MPPPSSQPPSGLISILYTDIVDFSRMAAALGETFRAMNEAHLQRVRTAIGEHRGLEIETRGDSFLVVFERADDALACAVAIHTTLATPPITATDKNGKTWALQVRLGVHRSDEEIRPRVDEATGFVSYAGYSDLNFAARVMGLASGGQLLVSASAHRAAPSRTRYEWQEWPNRRLKSFDQPEAVWELKWDGRSRGEPGLRYLPDWFLGEPNRYIARPAVEARVLGLFATPRPDGRVPRLVTICGFGGMGKTRLSVACALQAVGLFDGVYFVRLDDRLPTREAVAEAIGAAFGWSGPAALPDTLLPALREQNALLVLDNYESVDSDDVQQFLSRLITQTRQLRLLATGREAVKLDDAEYLVDLGDPRNHMTAAEARELFVERARQKRGQEWTPDERDAVTIRRIVELTDHIPLALELAAAWVKSRTLAEIAAGIAATPLGEATAEPPRHGRADRAERHRSLTGCLDWSFNLLDAPAQDALARLGVFGDSFTAATAKEVCELPSAQTMLDRLQDASLVRRVEVADKSRYDLNRFTRCYAAEKLDSLPGAEAIRRRYVAHYRALVIANRDNNNLAKLAVLDGEWRNAIAAAEAAERLGDGSAVDDLSAYLGNFLMLRGLWSEREGLNQRAVAAARAEGDRQAEGRALNNLGSVYQLQGRWAEAEGAYQGSLAIKRKFGDRVGEGQTLENLALLRKARGHLPAALALEREALQVLATTQDEAAKKKARSLIARWEADLNSPPGP